MSGTSPLSLTTIKNAKNMLKMGHQRHLTSFNYCYLYFVLIQQKPHYFIIENKNKKAFLLFL